MEHTSSARSKTDRGLDRVRIVIPRWHPPGRRSRSFARDRYRDIDVSVGASFATFTFTRCTSRGVIQNDERLIVGATILPVPAKTGRVRSGNGILNQTIGRGTA